MARDPLLGTFASRKNIGHAIARLKIDRNYRQRKAIIAQGSIYRIAEYVTGFTRASEWEAVLQRTWLKPSTTWIEEFGWLCHGFIHCAADLNRFLETSTAFRREYLLGLYDRAETTLAQVQENSGLSLWLVEQQFMLFQAKEGFDDHKAHLQAIQSSIQDPLLGYIITMMSSRLEPHVTPESFRKRIEAALKSFRERKMSLLADLISLDASPFTREWADRPGVMLNLVSARPLVDRYTAVKRILAQLPPVHDESSRSLLREVFTDLLQRVHDPDLDRISNHLLGSTSLPSEFTDVYLRSLDMFYSGNFADAASAAFKLLSGNPESFSHYWLVARAHACGAENVESTLNPKCPAGRILRALQQTVMNQVDIEASLAELANIALKLGSCALGVRVWQYVEGEMAGEVSREWLRYAVLTGGATGPEESDIDVFFFDQNLNEAIFETHPSLTLLRARRDLEMPNRPCDVLLPAFFWSALAVIESKRGEPQCALDYIGRFHGPSVPRPVREFLRADLARLEFDCLVKLGRVDEAATSVISNYAENSNSLRHLRFECLIDSGRAGSPELLASPARAILVFLNNGDEQDIYEAVDDYLTCNGMIGPLDVLDRLHSIPAPVSRVLLRDVLVLPVLMRGPLWAATPSAQRDMRTQILKTLFAFSVADQEFVIKELSEIEQARLLEDAFHDVEGPKFSIDYADHNRALIKILEGAFERYLAYRAYEDKGGQLLDENTLLEKAQGAASARTDRRPETSDVLLSNIAATIILEYLWHPQTGVNATLSTRIRHGSLENQFMRVFDAHHLLATRELSGDYRCHRAVMNILDSCTEDERSVVQQALTRFTIAINEIYLALLAKLRFRVPAPVLEHLKDAVPVAELVSDGGLLNLEDAFSATSLAKLKHAAPKNIISCITEVQNLFVDALERALTHARNHIATAVATQVDQELAQLDQMIASSLRDGWEGAQLRNEIMSAKAAFPNDLKIIQTWFNVVRHASTGDNTVARLFTTAARVVDFASNGRLGVVTPLTMDDSPISREHSLLLYEVLSILLRNIVQHACPQGQQQVKYSFTRVAEEARRIKVSNLVQDERACLSAVEHAQAKLAMPVDVRVLDRSPGGTGLRRIRALLAPISNREVSVTALVGAEPREFCVTIDY